MLNIDVQIIKKERILSRQQRIVLCADISEEIYEDLKTIAMTKHQVLMAIIHVFISTHGRS